MLPLGVNGNAMELGDITCVVAVRGMFELAVVPEYVSVLASPRNEIIHTG